jgi:hypothetical protein
MLPEAKIAIEQLVAVRRYTLGLLRDLDDAEWFRMPAEGVTHVAWQVGHLAVAEYRLALYRIRGPMPDDAALIPDVFSACYRAGTTAKPDPQKQPSVSQLRAVLDRVHEQALKELTAFAGDWLESTVMPHPQFTNKLGSLLWCGQHEMIHAGQIGLLRRLLGHAPMW